MGVTFSIGWCSLSHNRGRFPVVISFQMTSRGIVYDWLTMPFLLPFFLLHLWTLCPEVSCYYFYYLRKYNDNPHKNNNTTNQTSNDTIQCQYSHTSCNSKILRHKKHTHFSDTIGTSYQNPIKEIIKPICFITNRITGNHPKNKNAYRNNYFKRLWRYISASWHNSRRSSNISQNFSISLPEEQATSTKLMVTTPWLNLP